MCAGEERGHSVLVELTVNGDNKKSGRLTDTNTKIKEAGVLHYTGEQKKSREREREAM